MTKEGIRILVVDDDESLRGVMEAVLSEDGHDVVTADSAEIALQLFAERPFPLVITDIRMGGMNGIELLGRIKEMNEEVQVVIMTSYASVETAVSALRSGAYDYLIKPFDDLELISAVVNRAIEKIRLTVENKLLVQSLTKNKEELEQLNKVLRELAIRDGLTGLYNHRYFQEALDMELARSRRHKLSFSILFIDLDNFKQYNDTHGHPEGDRLLKDLGRMVCARLRSTDVVARYGGEEIIVLLPETPKDNATVCAENLRRMIASYPFPGRETQPLGIVSMSMGVAAFPEDGEDARQLIRMADDALYRAKKEGRNRVCPAGPCNS